VSSVLPKAAAMTSLDSGSTSGSWEVIPEWQIRTDIHPLVCPGMSEQVAPTAQLYECYSYLAPAVLSRHTPPTVPQQALLPPGSNNQRWITPQQSQAQGNYNITAGPALPSGSHFSQVTTTAAAIAKRPPPLLPSDNATTFTMGTKNHGDQKPWGPKPPPGSPPSPHPTRELPTAWQQPAREPWQPPSSETWQPRAREPWQPPPLPADHNRHQ